MEQLKELADLKEMTDSFMSSGKDEEDETSTFERVTEKIMGSPIVQAVGARIVNGPAPAPAPVARRRLQSVPAETPTAPPNPLDGVDPAAVAGAVGYMESAVANGVAAETFAQSIRSQAPPSLIDGIQKMGIDTFLDKLGLADGSPLATQVGRNWARRVARALNGPEPTAEVAEDPEVE